MSTLETVLLLILVVDAIALAVLVLIQQGKGADVGAAFGSGGANTVFGSAGSASFLTKVTAWLAIGFFVVSFALAYTAKERAAGLMHQGLPQSVIEEPAPESDQSPQTVAPDMPLPDVPADETGDTEIPDL